MKLKSDFAILDVKGGRAALRKHLKDRPALGPCPPEMRIPVVITGFIDAVHGKDDGISQEFSIDVTNVTVGA